MKFNIKSRMGFTLIELLVVIGILAVLAAIAIPSVAGLIDRANVSADKTNSNEMTNAIERFASEYELYCQDIASGALDPDNLDSAQGRVKNVVGVTTRAGIEDLEIGQGETVANNVIAIYRDTKYPVNAETMKKVVENYTKTSSSTFEPKQSDMHYWYSPDCGVVVFAEPDADIEADLNSQIQSGQDAKGNQLSATTQWIDLTLGAALSGGASLDMSTVDSTLANNDWETIQAVIRAGKVTDAGWKAGDLTPSFTINGNTKQARIVDIDNNKVTFMLTSSIGNHNMNTPSAEYEYGDNIGGYADSEMKTWLDGDIYNSLNSDFKAVISRTEITCGDGYNNPNRIKTANCYLFLPSIKEVGLDDNISNSYLYVETIIAEGETFDWFANGGHINAWFWLRSPDSNGNNTFFNYDHNNNGAYFAYGAEPVYPAFVIS